MLKPMTKRQETIYQDMRSEAKRGYEHFNSWDWNSSSYWHEKETLRDIERIKIEVDSKIRNIDFNLKHNFITEERYNLEKELLNQINKFCETRISILLND